ncbi:hypothetical protein ACHHYP_15725 [Achlya hypogyna]|uniref:Transmembrane protein n=1 Tax=Achlya hypogyna TaxID=1202772 RepID=A0A1V9YA75_ACHHY|nr:hypothetical protein ACHHYP_15725 [Achlya hypogyna]
MGVRGDIIFPRRARSNRVIAALAVTALCTCAAVCFVLATQAQSRHRTGASDLFAQGAIASRLCPQETVVYVFTSGCIYAAWAVVALLTLAMPRSRGVATVVFVVILSVGCVGWGVAGAIWSSRKGCPENEPWLFTTALATSVIFIFVCMPVGGLLVSYSLRALVPTHHREQWLLGCLRCSCLSPAVKRCCALAPFVALTVASTVLYARYSDEPCTKPFALYLAVASGLFGALTLFLCTCALWSSKAAARRAVVGGLLLLAAAALAWAVVGTTFVAHPVGCSADLFHAVQAVRVLLFAASGTLGSLTLCCQVERFCQSPAPLDVAPTLAIDRIAHVV